MDLAISLGLDVLLEVHERNSLLRAMELIGSDNQNCLLGINNRNLKTMVIDLANSEELATLTKGRVAVSESGIKKRSDVERLINAGFNGVLIGKTLMHSDDISEKFCELFNPNRTTKN